MPLGNASPTRPRSRSDRSGAADRLRAAAPLALPLLLALAVFGQVAGFGFISLDDPTYVSRNPHLANGLNGPSALWALTATYASNWHPVTWLSHLTDIQLFGLDAGGHHVSSLVIHLANTALLFLVLRRLTGLVWRSALAACLFAVHPLHVESVAWISDRKDLLAGFFWLLTTYLYAGWLNRRGPARLAAVLAAYLLGLASKAVPVALPCVLLLLDWWPLGRFAAAGTPSRVRPTGAKRLVLEKIPLFGAAAVAAAVTWSAQAGGGAVAPFPLAARVANAVVAYAQYLGATFWPASLSVFYPYPPEPWPTTQVVASVALLLCGTALALGRAARAPWVATGWLWFLVALLPSAGLVQVGAQAIADRYTYIPLAGLFIAAVWSIPAPGRRAARAGAATAAAALLGTLAAAAWSQTRLWSDEVALYRHSAHVVPDNWGALTFLGDALVARGDLEQAETALRRSVDANPSYFGSRLVLGKLLARQGRHGEALEQLRRAAQISPLQAELSGLREIPGVFPPEAPTP